MANYYYSTMLDSDGDAVCTRNDCSLTASENAKNDAVAGLRILTALLSILGAVSIVVSAVAKKRVSSPKVLPIFVLSISDALLAVMWATGAVLWLKKVKEPWAGCLTVSVLTVILECVSINLTLVYAIFAHAHVKQTNLNTLLTNLNRSRHVLPPLKILGVYFLAWILPAFLVLPFFIKFSVPVLDLANNCSCWCSPVFSNVLPLSHNAGQATMSTYGKAVSKIGLTYTVAVSSHYLIVFILLLVFYYKILKHIRRMRKRTHMSTHKDVANLYGATEALIVKGQSQAKSRIVLFLTIFVISGFCNLVLAIMLMVHLVQIFYTDSGRKDPSYHRVVYPVILIQSVTVPLQGFLNAIVYGWTREDFLHVMARRSSQLKNKPTNHNNETADPISSDFEDSVSKHTDYDGSYRHQTPEPHSGTFH